MRMVMVAFVALALAFRVNAEKDLGQATKTKSICLIPTAKEGGANWKYMESPKRITNWMGLTFNDKAWKTGKSGFGYFVKRGDAKTPWSGGRKDLYLRKEFKLDHKVKDVVKAVLNFAIDDSFEVWLNGRPLFDMAHYGPYEYGNADVTETFKRLFRETGRSNVIAVKAHDIGGACFVDVGLSVGIIAAEDKGIKEILRSGDLKNSTEKVAVQKFKIGSAPGTIVEIDIDGCSLQFVSCPAGSYCMGYSGKPEIAACREIEITSPFWITKSRVRKEHLDALGVHQDVSESPEGFARVNDASLLVQKIPFLLKKRLEGRLPEGYVFRLPTEAEFEYVKKAGAKGDDPRLSWGYRDEEDIVPNPWGVQNLFHDTTDCLFDRAPRYGKGVDVVNRLERNIAWTDLVAVNYKNQPKKDPVGWCNDDGWTVLRRQLARKLTANQGVLRGSTFYLVLAPDVTRLNKFMWR